MGILPTLLTNLTFYETSHGLRTLSKRAFKERRPRFGTRDEVWILQLIEERNRIPSAAQEVQGSLKSMLTIIVILLATILITMLDAWELVFYKGTVPKEPIDQAATA